MELPQLHPILAAAGPISNPVEMVVAIAIAFIIVIFVSIIPYYRLQTKWPPMAGRIIFSERNCYGRTDQTKIVSTNLVVTDQCIVFCNRKMPGNQWQPESQVTWVQGLVYTYSLTDFDARMGGGPDGRTNVILTARQYSQRIPNILYLKINNDPEGYVRALTNAQIHQAGGLLSNP